MKFVDKMKKLFSADKARPQCLYGPPSMLGLGKDKDDYRSENDIVVGIYGPPSGYVQQPAGIGSAQKDNDTKDNDKGEDG